MIHRFSVLEPPQRIALLQAGPTIPSRLGCWVCLKPGAVVRCRTRRDLVEEVQPPIHRPLPKGGDRVVTLACREDDAIGQSSRACVLPSCG